jgi:cytochrome c oxidase subunit 3
LASEVVNEVHAETPALREQFDTEAQQKDASTLGMWIFLITEIMFFGGMFLAYTAYRSWYPNVFGLASKTLNATIGAVNTAVLLCSSFTMVLAVRSAQLGRRKAIMVFLTLTLLLGLVFLGVKGYEWNEKFQEHHVPGPSF